MSFIPPIIVDNFTNRPTTGQFVGQKFIPQDGGYEQIWTGLKWQPIVKNVLCTEPPDTSSLSIQVNYSTTTLTKSNGILKMNSPSAGSTQLRCALMTIPTPSACEIQTLPILLNSQITTSSGVPCVGVCMRESSSGKIVSIKYGLNMAFSTASIVTLGNWSSATTRTTNFDYSNTVTPLFVRMRIVSGNILREVSQDLNTWDQVRSDAVTSLFTTAPDQYGICIQVENTMIGYLPHVYTV